MNVQLLIILVITVSCNDQRHVKEIATHENSKTETFQVGPDKVPTSDKTIIIRRIDTLAARIDKLAKEYKSYDTTLIYLNDITRMKYTAFNIDTNDISKILITATYEKGYTNFTYYYEMGKLVKSINDYRDVHPYKSDIYFYGDQIIRPERTPRESAEKVRSQAEGLLHTFKYR